jgi:hypothetical protein
MKTIVLTEKEWNRIHRQLAAKYHDKPSVLLIKTVMRRELGFTVRRHKEWVKDSAEDIWNSQGMYEWTIRLDFYNDELETLFRLTYL